LEDLKQGTNKEFGPKDIFEIASRNRGRTGIGSALLLGLYRFQTDVIFQLYYPFHRPYVITPEPSH
jgi:hypothetical protein